MSYLAPLAIATLTLIAIVFIYFAWNINSMILILAPLFLLLEFIVLIPPEYSLVSAVALCLVLAIALVAVWDIRKDRTGIRTIESEEVER